MFTFIDLFSGIGGFRLAAAEEGGRCVFASEIDRDARAVYAANYGDEPAGDIRQIDPATIPDHTILFAGFPCQPFSVDSSITLRHLGRPVGTADAIRGTLFREIVAILAAKRPPFAILENVKNLISTNGGADFWAILSALEEIGYAVVYAVLNADGWVPQDRQRVYIVCFNLDYFNFMSPALFVFPPLPEARPVLRDILETEVPEKYTLTPGLWTWLQNHRERNKANGRNFGYRFADLDGKGGTLPRVYYKDGHSILIPQAGGIPRKLTPREAARYMGFPDWFVLDTSDRRAYEQLGNAVCPPVIGALIRQLKQFAATVGLSDRFA